MLELICKELGVEVGEEFTAKPSGEDEQRFRLDKIHGLQAYNGAIETWVGTSSNVMHDLIRGKLKPIWKPMHGEDFFVSDVTEENLYRLRVWGGFADEKTLWERGLVFRHRKEAIEAANKMLEVLKHD